MSEKDLLYIPSLDYQKDYSSAGRPTESIDQYEERPDSDYTDHIEDLIDTIGSIRDVIGILPDDMRKAAQVPLRGVEYVIGTIESSDYDGKVPQDRDIIITIDDIFPPTIPDQDDDLPPADPFDSTIIDPVVIDVSVISKDEIIDKKYAHDLISVLKDYTAKMENALTAYASMLVTIAGEAGVDLPVLSKSIYTGSASNIKDKNNLHLSDAVIRMQIMRDQKVRLFTKLYDIDSTILHIRACKAATELRKRYYQEEYKEAGQLMDITSNTILSDSRAAYDKKYKENFKNLYKYLNSSVILINECMQMHLQEIQAKAVLINKEGMDIK